MVCDEDEKTYVSSASRESKTTAGERVRGMNEGLSGSRIHDMPSLDELDEESAPRYT